GQGVPGRGQWRSAFHQGQSGRLSQRPAVRSVLCPAIRQDLHPVGRVVTVSSVARGTYEEIVSRSLSVFTLDTGAGAAGTVRSERLLVHRADADFNRHR